MKKRITCRYNISQKTITHLGLNQKEIMENIANFLNVNLNYLFKNNPLFKPQFTIQSSSISSNEILFSYFEKYPVFSSKYLNYKDWNLVFHMLKKKEHLNPSGFETIIKIKEGMNNNRKFFNWTHLENLYSPYLI